MPVIKMSDVGTTTTLPPDVRESLLVKLKSEFQQSTEGGPVIFEIPLGTDCFDVLVVWREWAKVPSADDRTRLILDAYGENQEKVAQAMGVTFEEAMEQQLLRHVVVSQLENHKFAWLACDKDEERVEKLLDAIRDEKRANGGFVLAKDRVELRFPARSLADSICRKLSAEPTGHNLYWSVVSE